jgi:hypothetical protein
MRRLTTWAAAAVLPALLVSAALIGCSGGDKDKGGDQPKSTDTKDKGTKGPKGALTALEAKGKGTVKGKVKLAGPKPDFAKENADLLAQMKQKDEAHCVANAPKEQVEQQHWRISDDGGIANVFVWLQPPAGQYFKLEDKDVPESAKKDVELDQPHCAFVPHALVLFPSYRDPADPKKMKKTGQRLVVKNSNTILHNTDLKGGTDNPGGNNAIQPGGKIEEGELNPSPEPIAISCQVHPWMNAYARAFDHPYATLTDKDGNFEIKDAPAGAKLHLVIWHERGEYGDNGKGGKEVELKPGETVTENFELKVK